MIASFGKFLVKGVESDYLGDLLRQVADDSLLSRVTHTTCLAQESDCVVRSVHFLTGANSGVDFFNSCPNQIPTLNAY